MPQIIDIPNVGQVEFPDTMNEADISAAAQKLYQESAPAQVPAEVALPIAEQMVPQQPTFEMPATLTEQVISPERAATAVTAGALALPRLALSAYEFAKPPQPLQEEFARLGIEEPTFAQALERTSPDVKAIVAFEPQTPIEYAAEALGGIALEAPKIITAAGKTAKAAKALQSQVEAYDDAAGALFKRGAFGDAQARFEQPAVKAITLDAKEVKAAKGLEKTLTRQENFIAKLDQEQLALETLPNKTLDQSLEVAKLKGKSERAYQKYFKTIRDNQEVIESEPFKILKKEKTLLSNKTVPVEGKELPLYSQTISKRGVYVPSSEIEAIQLQAQSLARPGIVGLSNRISAGPISTVDHLRLIQEADGNILQGPMFKLLFEPAEIAKRNRQTMIVDDIANFRGKINELGLAGLGKQRKELLFDVADGKIARDAANLTDQENDLLNYMAKNYNDYLDRANAVRAKLDMDLIPKRQNYITHISDMSLYDELGFGLDSAMADTKLSKIARPLKAKFGFEKQRQGGLYRKDPIEAFERYVNAVSKQIHYTEPAAVLNARTDFITDPVLKNAQKRFINEAFLDQLDFKDDVLVQLGMRGPLNLAAKLSNNFSVAAILGNVTVTASQLSQVPATVKETGAWPAMVGLYRAFKPVPKEVADASSFLRLRQISDEAVALNSNVLNKPREFILKALEFTDKYVARASWEAGFVNAKRRGFSTEAAIKYADEIGRMLHANYGSIYKPSLLRGQTGKALLPLQSFFFNAWNYLSRDQKAIAELKNTTRLRETMKAIGAMAAANQIYSVFGLPTPFALEAPQSMDTEELLRVAKNVTVGNVSAARLLVEGVRPPAHRLLTTELGLDKKSLMRNSYTALFSDDATEQEEAQKALGKGILQFAPGGMQIKKTWEGNEAARDGYVNIGREFIPLTEEDKRLAPIVGKYQVPSVRKARQEIERRKIKRQLEGK